MKTWHWIALGVAAYVVWAYRGRLTNALSAGQGPSAVMLPTPNPSAGIAGLTSNLNASNSYGFPYGGGPLGFTNGMK